MKTTRTLLAAVVAAFGGVFLAETLSAATFFVAPNGKDANPGTKDQPMATLEAARDAARKAGGENRIVLAPGDYFVTKTLELDARDNSLTIEAATAGKTTLYGGKVVTGWQRDGDKFWAADLPGVKEGKWDFRALIVNGRMAPRSRFPETGELLNKGTWKEPLLPCVAGFWDRKPTREDLTVMPYDAKDIPATLEVKNAEVRMYHMWDESLVGVAKNDTEKLQLIFSSPAIWPAGALGLKRYVVFNTREGMTQPGQWYLDRAAGRLVYWPLPGEDMAKLKVIAPTVERIVRIAGNAKKKAKNITLRGLSLQATTAPQKSAGFGGGALAGALTMTFAEKCAVENTEICNVGALGIAAQNLVDCRIVDCPVHHTGACGCNVNGDGVLFSKNHVHHVGFYYPSAAALMLGGAKMHIYRNEVHDSPYSGVIVGGRDHLIEENLIYRVMRELHDGAAIYGNMIRCTIRGNMVRDVVEFGKGFGASAYYLDEGAIDCVVERNVAIGVPMPTHNHITRNTVIRDNVFVTDGDIKLSFPRSSNVTFERNTVFAPGKVNVSQPNAVKTWKDNVIYHGGLNAKGQPQAFTIDNAMPAAATPAKKSGAAAVLAAEKIQKAPTLDGDMTPGEWPGKLVCLDRDVSRQMACGAPAFVKLAYDDHCLYVAVMASMFAPAKISDGSAWGKDDGVEITVAGIDADGKPAAFVLRGYANGKFESLTTSGASKADAERVGKAVRFAAARMKTPYNKKIDRGWCGEWAIPFEAIGLKSAAGLKTQFNIAVYYADNAEWHCWEGMLGKPWNADQAGVLQLK